MKKRFFLIPILALVFGMALASCQSSDDQMMKDDMMMEDDGMMDDSSGG